MMSSYGKYVVKQLHTLIIIKTRATGTQARTKGIEYYGNSLKINLIHRHMPYISAKEITVNFTLQQTVVFHHSVDFYDCTFHYHSLYK